MRRTSALAAMLLALLALAAGGAIAAPAGPPPLRLRYLEIPPAERGAALSALPAPAGRLLVQFAGPVGPAERGALAGAGVELLEYLPDYAYLVAGPPDRLAAAAALPGLARALPAPAALQLDAALLRAVAAGRGVGPLRLSAWPGREAALAAELAAAGIRPDAPLGPAELRRLAGLSSLRWAEPAGQPRLLNDSARVIMGVDASAWAGAGLYGQGQVLAIADSGLDTGDPATISADFAGRIVATHVLSPSGDLEDENGHGTHVAGSALGSGAQSGANPAANQYAGSFAGVAPRAGLVYQAFETDSNNNVYGLPADYYALFAQAYGSGARLHSNSWGDITGPPEDAEAMFGGYPYGSQRADQFVWDNPDMALFFAAGNSGLDGTPGTFGFCTGGDGVIDPDSLLAPATAKNVITVGASENQRASGSLAGISWLLFNFNFCFATQPIATDTVSNNPNGMAAFSSRGPTDDGRAKPDIVAPGTNIVSNRSAVPGVQALAHETNPNYAYNSGTSMATPLVAGAGTLVREWLVKGGAANPSAALIKAVLLNTARDMAPGQYGTGPTQEIPAARPNSVSGWGRADLGFLSAAAPFAIWHDDRGAGLATGQQVEYTHSQSRPLQVSGAGPLRVQLVWTDPPASLAASRQLVNDLDLVLTGPDGTTYYGNGVATGDRVNNVEGIVVSSPAPGSYRVSVRAHNVPISPQPYALVVSGPIGAAPQPQTISFPAPQGLTYGDPPATLAATASSGLPVSYSVLSGPASVSGASLTISGAGEVRVRASQAGGAGYAAAQAEASFTVAQAALSVRADDQVRKVGLANPPLSLSYSGFVNGDGPADLDTPPAASTTATPASPAGDYPITAAGGADADYRLSYTPGTLRVTSKDIPTLTWAQPAAIRYGAALGSAQLSASARFGGGAVAGSYSYSPPAGTRLVAGLHTLRVTFTPADGAAFESVSAQVTLQVDPVALAIVAEDKEMRAGAAMPALTARYSGFVNGEGPADLDSPAQLSAAATPASPPGDYPITVAGAADANYTIVTVPGRLRVLPRQEPPAQRLYLPELRR